MSSLAKIINNYVFAVIVESKDEVSYEACACNSTDYCGFFFSEKLCLNFIKLIVAQGFECKVSFDGLFYRYHLYLAY